MLSVDGLTRTFGSTVALDAVTFEVAPGRMTGFVGANGAGKTTAMRIIVGVLSPTSGSVTWDGVPISAEQRRHIGYMPEERGLYPKMRVLDQLVFFGRLHGMSAADAAERAGRLLDRLGLHERRDAVLETLSLGNQQRVQIVAALVHRPTALVLDEPFSGLDPLAVDTMVTLLHEEVAPQMPVLFSSHQLDLVERVCDDLVILSEGRVVAAGTADELRDRQEERYRVRVAGAGAAGALVGLPGLEVLDADGDTALLALADAPDAVLPRIVERAPVAEFNRVVRSLSEVYRDAVR